MSFDLLITFGCLTAEGLPKSLMLCATVVINILFTKYPLIKANPGLWTKKLKRQVQYYGNRASNSLWKIWNRTLKPLYHRCLSLCYVYMFWFCDKTHFNLILDFAKTRCQKKQINGNICVIYILLLNIFNIISILVIKHSKIYVIFSN